MHLVIFDIDGTLIHSHQDEADCFISALKQITGISHVSKDLLSYQHVTDTGIAMECIEKQLGRKSNATELAAIEMLFLDNFTDALLKLPTAAISGAWDVIPGLLKQNIAVAVATGSYAKSAEMKLRAANLDFVVPTASCNDSFSRIEIMSTALAKAKIHYQQSAFDSITYVGDAPWDVKAVQSLAWHFIGIASEFTIDSLSQCGAKWIAMNYEGTTFKEHLREIHYS